MLLHDEFSGNYLIKVINDRVIFNTRIINVLKKLYRSLKARKYYRLLR